MARCPEVHEAESAAYDRLVTCDRPAGHEGQHEVFTHDLAWGPPEPTTEAQPHA